MNFEPKADFLYSCTTRLAFLVDRLRNGIWPRFCEEELDWLVQEHKVIAYPCVCFCDIPKPSNSYHRQTYGDFAIAVSKELAGQFNINPMWYLQEDSAITKHLQSQFKKTSCFSLSSVDASLRPILPYLKPTLGFQPDRHVSGATEVRVFEEEMEWRYSPPELSNQWIVRDHVGFLTEDDHKVSEPNRLQLTHSQVEQVLVPSSSDQDAIRRAFPHLASKVHVW